MEIVCFAGSAPCLDDPRRPGARMGLVYCGGIEHHGIELHHGPRVGRRPHDMGSKYERPARQRHDARSGSTPDPDRDGHDLYLRSRRLGFCPGNRLQRRLVGLGRQHGRPARIHHRGDLQQHANPAIDGSERRGRPGRQVAAGSNFAAAIASDGSLWTWGANTSGQLGYTTATSSSNTSTAPAQAPTPTGAASNTYWTAVAAGADFVVALRSDNTLWAWGDNTSGQFGNGATGTSSSTSTAPVPGAGGTWTAVSAGSNFVIAIKSGGALMTWGANNSSQLGTTRRPTAARRFL